MQRVTGFGVLAMLFGAIWGLSWGGVASAATFAPTVDAHAAPYQMSPYGMPYPMGGYSMPYPMSPYGSPYPMGSYGTPNPLGSYILPMPGSTMPYGTIVTSAGPTGVSIANFAFNPQAMTVTAGQSVTWTNADRTAHTTTADSGAWNSGPIQPGASYSQTFSTPGTFTYHCAIHSYMTGSVTVLAATAGSGAGPATTSATSPPVAGLSVSFGSGWNLAAGPAGTTLSGANGALYTFRAGDIAYETVPAGTPLAAGSGYWAYFNASAIESLPLNTSQPAPIQLPAGQYVLIGNPSTLPMVVAGADTVLTYDSLRGYQSASLLQPGQGAWAFSSGGGTLNMRASVGG